MYSAETIISHVFATHPGATAIFAHHGLSCGSCLAAGMESLAAVSRIHDVCLDDLLAELNDRSAGCATATEGE